MKKTLAVHLIYSEGNITYFVATQSETNTQQFNVFKGRSPSLSDYMILRTIQEGKQASAEEAINYFSKITTHSYSKI